MTVFDISLRIGAHLRLEPRLVYLHAGAKKGATALGLGRGRNTLAVDELPVELRGLSPREIEDCLCIYKDELAKIGARPG